jgi:hypothetical protein
MSRGLLPINHIAKRGPSIRYESFIAALFWNTYIG